MYLFTATTAILALAFPSLITAIPQRPHGRYGIQYKSNETRANAVKKAFQTAWDGYYEYSYGHDSLRPVSNSYDDDRNGWGASAVDAFSTALVMENFEVVNQILAYVQTIDFDNAIGEVSLFETTIRYLGGLLSAYDLLQGPLKGKSNDTVNVDNILKQAQHLADNLKVAFVTPSGIPDNSLYFTPPRIAKSTTNGLATIGTLVMEWTRLSDLTGDEKYGRLAQAAEEYLLHPKPELGEPFPGLLGMDVNITTGLFIDSTGGWVGGADSFYEYLIKMYLYDPDRFAEYKERWIVAVESSIKYLTSHPTTRPDLTFLAVYNNRTLSFVSQHLACFDGGNFILGGLVLNEPRYVEIGLDLTSACRETYIQTTTGIGPEVFHWQDSRLPLNATNNPGPPAAQADFYRESGFWITASEYVLRPEVIESFYYAYRATGDTKYQEWAWDAFLRINATCRVGSGFSSVMDVNAEGGGTYTDFQESFWFAEVLKYSYLIHAEEADWQVKADHSNMFVYNTEAHPIRLARGSERVGGDQAAWFGKKFWGR